MSVVALAVLPVFLLILCGIGLRRLGFPGDAFWAQSDRLVYWILFPALLFHKTATADITGGLIGAISVVSLGAFGAASLFAIIVSRHTGLDNTVSGSVFQGATRHNTFIAFAIADSLLGPEGMLIAAIVTAVLVPVTNLVCVTVLIRLRNGRARADLWRPLTAELLRNPLIGAIAAGLTLNLTGLSPLPVVHDMAGLLSRAALPVMLLGIGAGLRLDGLALGIRPLAISIAGKFVVFTGTVYLLVAATGLTGTPALVLAIYGTVPTAASGYALARQLGADARLMATIITVQTGLALLTVPPMLLLASRLFAS